MKIENIYVCPKCDYATPGSKKPRYCTECGYSYIENNFSTYTSPVTITEQLKKLNNLEGARDAILGLTQDKALSILDDALKIVETLAGRKTKAVDIRTIVERAIAIGEVAKAYDAYIKAGGKHVPSLFINNDNNEEIKNESDGASTTGSAQEVLGDDSNRRSETD